MTLDQFYKLSKQGCSTPGCGHAHEVMFLHSRCHPSSGTSVSFDPQTRVLKIECRTCRRLVVDIDLPASEAS